MDEFKTHKIWIYYLTALWLIATFEHNYFTLHSYTHNIYIYGIPISGITAFLLVVALDLSIFWSVMFLPSAKKYSIQMGGPKLILTISTIISILLNVRYMVTSSPSQSYFDIGVGVIVGILVPTFVVIFGWIEGNLMVVGKETIAIETKQTQKQNNKKEIKKYLKDHPRSSLLEVAKHFGIEAHDVAKIMEEK